MESPPGIRLVNISEYIKKGTEVPFLILLIVIREKKPFLDSMLDSNCMVK
jgi:hypothetical protein